MKLKKMIYPICAALLLVCAACNALNGSAVSELPSAGPGLSAASEPPAAGLELPDAEPELPAVSAERVRFKAMGATVNYPTPTGFSAYFCKLLTDRGGSRPLFESEGGQGAYYTVVSVEGTQYAEASASIVFPSGYDDAGGARTGYLTLGIWGPGRGGSSGESQDTDSEKQLSGQEAGTEMDILGTGREIQLGLQNTGTGWTPYCYDAAGDEYTVFGGYAAPDTAAEAVIRVRAVNTETVHLYIQFLDASGRQTGNVFDQDIPVCDGNLVLDGGAVRCRYFRSAALVPVDAEKADDRADGSHMLGAEFTDCLLYDGSEYVSWGIAASRVEDAWRIFPGCINVSCTEYGEAFDIRHEE